MSAAVKPDACCCPPAAADGAAVPPTLIPSLLFCCAHPVWPHSLTCHRTQYIFHRVRARVTGLPQGPFETYEPRPGGTLVTRWVWRDLECVESMNGRPTSSTG